MNVPVYNMQGHAVGQLAVDEKSLGGTINPQLIKQAFVVYHANTRQGSSRTKNRHEVEGSTRKIYKQKGTGNARHGDRKANLFKGGGHGHSKKRTREDYRLDMPKKMRRKANRNALLAKLVDNQVKVVDAISFAEPKTRAFQDFLGAIKVDGSALVALPMADGDRNTVLSARNVDGVTMCRVEQLTAFNMLNNRYLVITKGDLESWLKGPWSQTDKSAKISPLGAAAADEPVAKVPAAKKADAPKAKAAKASKKEGR